MDFFVVLEAKLDCYLALGDVLPSQFRTLWRRPPFTRLGLAAGTLTTRQINKREAQFTQALHIAWENISAQISSKHQFTSAAFTA